MQHPLLPSSINKHAPFKSLYNPYLLNVAQYSLGSNEVLNTCVLKKCVSHKQFELDQSRLVQISTRQTCPTPVTCISTLRTLLDGRASVLCSRNSFSNRSLQLLDSLMMLTRLCLCCISLWCRPFLHLRLLCYHMC